MICPNCGTENNEENVFCMECGARLKGTEHSKKSIVRRNLSFESLRTIIFVFGLLILNILLTNMSFLEDLQFQQNVISIPSIIKTIIYLVIIVILLRYAVALGQMWPNGFPKFSQASFFFQIALYIIAMIIFYDATTWIFRRYVEDQQIILIYQLLLSITAAILLIRAFIYFYRILPVWLHQINRSLQLPDEYFKPEGKE